MKYIIFLLIIIFSFPSFARDRLRIVGSSTLYPFITVVAERLGKNLNFKTPIVESIGTGGGINLFCSGNSIDYPDIAIASRKIKKSEIERCKNNGVNNIYEKLIGYDGIVIASMINSSDFNFSIEHIFNATAMNIPLNGKIIPNYNVYWDQIDSKFPHNKIEIYGPSFTSGTRENFIDIALVEHCITLPEFIKQYPDILDRKSACKLIRKDGRFIEISDNANLIINKIESNMTSFGIIGYNFLIENKHKIKGQQINNIAPTSASILNKSYPLSRELYLYLNKDHELFVEGLKEFINEFNEDYTIGKYGYLTLKGFISTISDLSKLKSSE